MSYSRPIVLTDGDIVSTVYFKRERQRWINYEGHAHADPSDVGEGGDLALQTVTGFQVLARHATDAE